MEILKITAVLAVFVFMSSGSCKKEPAEETLPPETQEGKNTIGCLVNGKVWNYGGFTFQPCVLCFGYSANGIGISAEKISNKTKYIKYSALIYNNH